ncbi:MAG: MBL fold metallo-hydrolase, partial [Promethearchaeota archaeon]
MTLTFEQLNPHSCLTYLMRKKGSDEVILIDPVLDHVNNYLLLLKERNMRLTHVIDTHTHADHISGAAALKDHTNCEYVMHDKAPSQCVTIRIKDKDEIKLLET